MTATLTPTPKMQFFDADGAPLVGGKVYTYQSGTSTPLATYTDGSGATPNANPVILDARGEANIWLGTNQYRFVLKNSLDVLIWTSDNVSGLLPYGTVTASSGSSIIGFIQPGAGAVARTVQDKLRDYIDGADYGMVGDGTTDNTAAFNNILAAAKASTHKTVYLAYGNYRFASKPADVDFALQLIGSGMVSTVLVRDYAGTPGIGMLNLGAGSSGAAIKSLSVNASATSSSGCAIVLSSTASQDVSGVILEDVWVSTFAVDKWDEAILVSGISKTSAPIGARTNCFKNVHVFGAATASVRISGVQGFSWMGGGIYSAGGTGTNTGGVVVTGIASVKSEAVNINLSNSTGAWTFSQCNQVTVVLSSMGDIFNANTATFVNINCSSCGTVDSNWSYSTVTNKYDLGITGYTYLSGGLLMQWGNVTTGAGAPSSGTITFSKPFSSTFYNLQLTPSGQATVSITSTSLSGAVVAASSAAIVISYVALGK